MIGCDKIRSLNIAYLHAGQPPFSILRDVSLPNLTDLTLSVFVANSSVSDFVQDVCVFNSFCAAHKTSLAQVQLGNAWGLSNGFLIEATRLAGEETCLSKIISQTILNNGCPASKLKQHSTRLSDDSEQLPNDIIAVEPQYYNEDVARRMALTEEQTYPTTTRYVARELRLAAGTYEASKGPRVTSLDDIIFDITKSRSALENPTTRWGTEVTRICLGTVYMNETIWNLEHAEALSKLRIFAVNQVDHTKAFCIGHVDDCWNMYYGSHLCKESSRVRYGDSASNACPAKRRVLKSMATSLCAKALPSLQIVYLDSERFWIERENGEFRKIWCLWDAMDDAAQRAKIEHEISLEDWKFLSCQRVDNSILLFREESYDKGPTG